jgi:hypothetical protein
VPLTLAACRSHTRINVLCQVWRHRVGMVPSWSETNRRWESRPGIAVGLRIATRGDRGQR